jgi:hypothetical protein
MLVKLIFTLIEIPFMIKEFIRSYFVDNKNKQPQIEYEITEILETEPNDDIYTFEYNSF